MDMAVIEITPHAARQLRKIRPPADKEKVASAIESLGTWPECSNVKAMKNGDGYRLRTGDWRIVFTVQGGRPLVVRIEEVRRRNERTYQ